MSLFYPDQKCFASGQSELIYEPGYEGDRLNRLSIPVILLSSTGKDFTTSAYIDTGGKNWLSPEVAQFLELDEYQALERTSISFRMNTFCGLTYKVRVVLINQDKDQENLEISATFFVADIEASSIDPKIVNKIPCLIGMNQGLEYCKFAIDPENYIFYFGK